MKKLSLLLLFGSTFYSLIYSASPIRVSEETQKANAGLRALMAALNADNELNKQTVGKLSPQDSTQIALEMIEKLNLGTSRKRAFLAAAIKSDPKIASATTFAILSARSQDALYEKHGFDPFLSKEAYDKFAQQCVNLGKKYFIP